MSWNDLFVNMDNTNFFNFSFLPKYGSAFVRGFEYTLLLAVVSVLLAVIPALLLAMMRLSKIMAGRCLPPAFGRAFCCGAGSAGDRHAGFRPAVNHADRPVATCCGPFLKGNRK